MTIEEMKQRYAALKRERDTTPRANRRRVKDIQEEMYDLRFDINKASEETERFRLRVIDTARQTWIHTPDEEKTTAWFQELFSSSEFFERAADNYMETGQADPEE